MLWYSNQFYNGEKFGNDGKVYKQISQMFEQQGPVGFHNGTIKRLKFSQIFL